MIRRLTQETSEAKLAMSEVKVLEAFSQLTQAEHANPARIGCPRRDVLMHLATAPATFHRADTLVHLGSCAPCLRELIELRSAKGLRAPWRALRYGTIQGC
jgi:hypothetical protein